MSEREAAQMACGFEVTLTQHERAAIEQARASWQHAVVCQHAEIRIRCPMG